MSTERANESRRTIYTSGSTIVTCLKLDLDLEDMEDFGVVGVSNYMVIDTKTVTTGDPDCVKNEQVGSSGLPFSTRNENVLKESMDNCD